MKERLDCEGDDASDGADACQQVTALSPADLEPVPPDMACTEIYGGPDTLEVSGTLDGEEVEATFTRQNGCEIARFDPWVPILRDLFPDYRPGESLSPA